MDKKYPLLLLLLLLNGVSLWAQKQTANWMMFPDSYHFSASNPNISTQYKDTFSFSSSMSDKNGNLLFYTNGFDVWNKLGQKMDGSGYILNNLPFQCCGSRGIPCIIVPSPSDTNQYFIFGAQSTGLILSGTNASIFSYAIVDMHLNSNNGKVISSQNIIDSSTSGVIAAVKHCNNKDYWIVTHRRYNVFLSVQLSSTGVSAPIESIAGVKKNFGTARVLALKISPNGKYIGLASNYDPEIHNEILNFNNQTGIVETSLLDYISTIPTTRSFNYGNIEFSSNSSKVYIVNTRSKLVQFDLSTPDSIVIKKSADSIDLNGADIRMLQLSLNKKIYLAGIPNQSIDYPDLKMSSPFFKLSKVPGRTAFFPNFVASYFNKPYTVDSFCLNTPTAFRALNAYQYDSIRWDFGDIQDTLNSSIDSITHHTYSTNGIFTATLKVYTCNSEAVFEIPVSISKPTEITFAQLDSLCLNTPPLKLNITTPDSGLYFIHDHLSDSLYPAKLGSGNTFVVYKFLNDSGCLSTDSTPVMINPLPTPIVSLSRSPFLCEGDSVILQSNYNTNQWSNGLTSKSITINTTKNISLTVTDSNGCKNTSAPVSIIAKTIPTTKIAPVNPVICEGTEFTLSASGIDDFVWSNGYRGSSQKLIASRTQTYKVTVSNYCGSAQDSVLITVLRSNAKAYPNPAQTYLSVDLSECEGIGQSIEIYDEIGRRINTFTTDNFEETIDLNMLAPGLYYCRVGKEHFSVFKFVIIK